MRVAQLIETLGAGGAEGLAVQIANSWADRGHEAHLIVIAEAGPFRAKLSPDVHFHELGLPVSKRSILVRLPAVLRALWKLQRLIGTHRIEAMQTHLPLANFFGLATAWWGSCRIYPTVHNNREFDYGDASGPVRENLRRFAYKRMLIRCRRMIAVSDRVKGAMARELDLPATWLDRIAVVPNGVSLPPAMSPADRTAARADWSVDDDEVLIVGVGRLTRQKNFGDLVQALAKLEGSADRWRCLIAGEGELRGEWEAQVASAGLGGRVAFVGHVADIGRMLGAADIFCLPSLYEGLPLVLLEAMAAGLPVAAFRIDGVTEVVEHDKQALLADPGSTDLLSRALGRLVSDPYLRRKLGDAGRHIVAEDYGFERVADLLEEVCAS